MDFPARLRHYRKQARLSQEELSAACGRSGQSWVSNLERGDRTPQFEDISKLAAALNIHPGQLFADLPSQPAGLSPSTVSTAHRLLREAYEDAKREPYSVESDPEALLAVSEKLEAIGDDRAAIASLGRSLGGKGDVRDRDERAGRAHPKAGRKRAAG